VNAISKCLSKLLNSFYIVYDFGTITSTVRTTNESIYAFLYLSSYKKRMILFKEKEESNRLYRYELVKR
jgi:hypothetical protein